jgi:hypothetical protein
MQVQGITAVERALVVRLKTPNCVDMPRILESAYTFLKQEDGPTTVEYAFFLLLVTSACFVSVRAICHDTNQDRPGTSSLRSSR